MEEDFEFLTLHCLTMKQLAGPANVEAIVGVPAAEAKAALGRLVESGDVKEARGNFVLMPPGRERLATDLLVERVSSWLMVGFGRLVAGGLAEEPVALARLACHVPADEPSAPALAAIGDLLADYRDLPPEPGSPREFNFAAILPIMLAVVLARTPDVPAPGVARGESAASARSA